MNIKFQIKTDDLDIDEIEKYKSQLLMRSEKGADKQDYIIDGKAYCKSDAICILDDLVHEFNIQDNNNYNYKG